MSRRWPNANFVAALSLVDEDELPNVYRRILKEPESQTLRFAIRDEYVARYRRRYLALTPDERAKIVASLEALPKLSIAQRWQLETLKGIR